MKTLKMNLFVLLVMVAYTMVKADTRSPSSSGANQVEKRENLAPEKPEGFPVEYTHTIGGLVEDDVENGQEGGGNSKITNQVGEGLSGGATDAIANEVMKKILGRPDCGCHHTDGGCIIDEKPNPGYKCMCTKYGVWFLTTCTGTAQICSDPNEHGCTGCIGKECCLGNCGGYP